MDRGTVVEVTSWNYKVADGIDFEELAENGCGGVVIKASQGVDWTFAKLPETIRCVKAAGLMVGVLHYAEPGRNDPSMEASHLVDSLPDDDLPLGLWLELDDLNGKQGFELADWVTTWTGLATLPKARPVVMCTPELLSQMAGAPWGLRWVATAKPAEGGQPWAEREPWEGNEEGVAGGCLWVQYQLATVRGLNRPETGATAVSPPPGVLEAPAAAEGPEMPDWQSPELAQLDAAADDDEPVAETE